MDKLVTENVCREELLSKADCCETKDGDKALMTKTAKDNRVLESVIKDFESKFAPVRDLVVKPLGDEMVKKIVTKQGAVKTDSEGMPLKSGKFGAIEYETEDVKELVVSELQKGIVIGLPANMVCDYELGDIVVYLKRFTAEFDLYKTARLVAPHNVIAIAKR